MDEGWDWTRVDERSFECTVHRIGRTSEIVLAGEVDLVARETLEDASETALSPGPIDTVLIDLTRVTFADSTSVSWLITLDRRARDGGTRVVAVTSPGQVRDLLHMTGLDGHITVVNDRRMR